MCGFCLVPAQVKLVAVIIAVFLPLVADIAFCDLTVDADSADEVALTPEGLLREGFLLPGELQVGTNSTLAFEETDDRGYAVLGRDGEDKVDMVWAGSALDDLDLTLLRQCPDDLSDTLARGAIQDLLSIFGNDHDMVDTFPSGMMVMVHG